MRALLPSALILAILFAGCASPSPRSITITHVHGLGYDPGADALYVASHHGLAQGVRDGASWAWQYVGTERYDFMGFTTDAVTPGTFYSSGHPDDPRAFGAVQLGLRRSQDNGTTWEQRSLKGQVDFHALTALPTGTGHLAGFFQGNLKVSQDAGATWQDHPVADLSVYALAASNDALWAGTGSGLKRTTDYATWTDGSAGRFSGIVSSIAISSDAQLLLVGTADGRSGSTFRSLDGGQTWTQLTPTPLRDAAAPVIFAIDPADSTHLFASTAAATILESTDSGATWTTIRP